jgi:multiple sugar transport system substrate-binding protein
MKTIMVIPVAALAFAAGLSGCDGGASISTTGATVKTPIHTSGGTERIPIRLFYWLQCCGAEPVDGLVEAFNASQDRIELKLEIPDGEDIQTLKEGYAAGTGPDILGPFPARWFDILPAEWQDLDPFIQSSGYDLAQFQAVQLSMYLTEEGRFSLPFVVNPSAVLFNTRLFDAAGLAYPPARYEEKYRMPDGLEVEWTWDVVRDIARMLTRDSGGRNAADPAFDRSNIVQYGFTWQYENHPNLWGSHWAGGSMLAPGGKEAGYQAQVPEAWRAAWRWTYDAIWGDRPFMGSAAVEGSQDFSNGNPFNSGKVAMTVQPSWYTCCMQDVSTWDAAAMPSYKGKIGGRIEESTFRIWKGTAHPAEAFEALDYLVREGPQKLIIGEAGQSPLYNFAVPARIADQKDWLAVQREKFSWVKNWDAILAGLNYPDIPGGEAYVPNYDDAWFRGITFAGLLRGTGGLDLDVEIEKYRTDLETIFNREILG